MLRERPIPKEWIDSITTYQDDYAYTAKTSIIPDMKDFMDTLEFMDLKPGNGEYGRRWERNCVGTCDWMDPLPETKHVHDYEQPGPGRYKIWRVIL